MPQFIITAQMQREGDGETWYTYDPNDSKATTALLGDNDKVNVQITVTNRTGKDVTGVTVYVPVPKTDSKEILGDYFVEGCGFDMLIASQPQLPTGWEAYYGDVTKALTIETGVPSGEFEFAGENTGWSSNYNNDTNLIQLRLNGTLSEGDTATLTLQLKPAGDTTQAGQTNLFKTWYTYNAAGVVMNDASKTTIFGAELQNGVVSGVVFEDADRDGVQDANEPGIPGVKVTAVDSTGREYPAATTDKNVEYQFTSVPTDVTLTVTVHNPKNPDPNHENGSYRFSPAGTGTGVVSNVTAATDNKSASKSGVSLSNGAATVNAGLITPYEVSFVVTAGSASPDSVKIYSGQKLGDVLPDGGVTVTPKDGDNFLNKWTKTPGDGAASSEVEHDNLLNETVSADTTYTAQLKAESYTIEAKYGETGYYTETVEHGNKISENFPTDETAQAAAPESQEFKGWWLTSSGEVFSREQIVGTAVTASATYFAKYERKSGITVTLDANGGSFGEDETTLELSLTYGDIITSAKRYVQPTWDGHTFLGWAESKDAGSEDVIANLTCPAESATYYAVWKENTYTITFQGYDQGSGTTTVEVKAGEAIGAEKIPTAEKTGAEFKGWSDGETTYSTEELADVVPEKDTTYTAQFTDIYTVTFYANGHGTIDGATSATRSVASGGSLSDIPTVDASEGWYFVWWADANGTTMYTSEALESLTITGPTNFYAQYGQISGNTSITLKTPVDNSTNSTTLTASLENGTPDSYKWQKLNGATWEDVTGGTSANLSLSGLKMADNNTQYRCVVTSGDNSAILGPVTLSVEKGNQPAPNVSSTQPSTINGTGSIGTGESKLTTAMEYKVGSDGDWTKVTDEVAASGITDIASGTIYYIRYAETDYLNASPAQTITIGSFTPGKEPTPNGSFEASDMTLSKVENGQEYRIGNEGEWIEITGATVDLSDAGLKAGDTIQIRKPGNGTTTTDSDTQVITLTQAAKPTGTATNETSYQGKDGAITITDYDSSKGYTYQISSSGGTDWTDATVGEGGVISDLAPGSYVIRVKGAGTMLASEPSDTLTVDPYVPGSEAKITSFEVTVNEVEYPGTIDQQAETITITLPAGTDPQVLNSLKPAITHTGVSISPDNQAQDFSKGGVTYTVKAENGTEKTYTATITIAEPETYTINVNTQGNGSITTTPSGSAAADTEVTLTINPDEGYKLTEGSLKVTHTEDGEQTVPVTGNKFTMPAANVTVSAEFEAIEYTITYNLNGGTNAEGNPDTYKVEDAITLSAPTKDGYTFTGWTWGGQTTPQETVTIVKGTTGDLTFTAHWQENPPTPPEKYTVTVVNSHADTTGAGDYEKGAEVTIYAGEYEGYTFNGWTVTSGNVTLTNASSATTTFAMPAGNVTVTATWTKAEDPDPAPAGTITVTPADIIIYMGGDKGYEGVVNGNGQIVGSNSLPEPGFVFALPEELETALAENSADITAVAFKNADGSKTWKVELYEGLDAGAERKLYTIVPTYEEPDPIRVVFTDGGTTIVSDNFTVGLELNKTFNMKLYTEPAGEIIAIYEGETYSVFTGSGELTVRGTTGEVEIVTVDTEAPESGVGVVAEADTTYTINGSEVKVEDASGVALLFDEIIEHSGSDRTGQLEDKAAGYLGSPSYRHEYAYEFKYLDLVDTNNGNAWVAASKDVTVYWPLPANADAASLKVLHFEGLYRSNENGGAPDVNDAEVNRVENVRIENGYVVFEVGSAGFSPFALVWEEKLPDVPVVDPDDDDDDDDEPGTVTPDDTGVSDWLDTKNHIQYLSGYGEGKFGPEDNMTRAQAAQMFYNLLLDKDVAITVSFSDVAENAWYAEAVNTLASLGIVDGVGGGLYAPERAITRAEFTVIAMRFAHLDTGGENIFSDVSRSDWFYDQVVGSVKYGWINGYADGTFRPNNTITRAEVTTIVNRMLGRSADREYVDANIGSLTQFNDISRAHWAYYEVMEAANAHDYAIVNGKEDWK